MLGHLTANLRETVRNQRPIMPTTLPQPEPLQCDQGLPQPLQDQKPEFQEQQLRSHRSQLRKARSGAAAQATPSTGEI